jgi:hypothetical protein
MDRRDYAKLQKQLCLNSQDYNNYSINSGNYSFGGQTKIKSIERKTDNIYVNVVVDHPEPTYNTADGPPLQPAYYLTGQTPINAEYNVTKTEVILDKASDYYCSVVRFTIPLDTTPLIICPIVPNQSNPNLTPLIIGIQYNGVRYPMNLVYISQSILQAPTQNQPLQVITPYYYMYTYQSFITMINIALGTAWTNSGLLAALPGYMSPYFILDPTTSLISLIAPRHFASSSPIAPLVARPTIFMNTALSNYLDAFNLSFQGYDRSPINDDYYFILDTVTYPRPDQAYYPGGVIVPPATDPAAALPAAPYYYKYTQEYPVLEYWSSLRKIIITTNAVPVNNELAPTTDNQNTYLNVNQNGVNVSYPILSDFVPSIDGVAGTSRSIAYYIPTGQYRLIDLQSDSALQSIDLRIYWQDRDGNLYPLQISLYQQASIKLAFIRKDLYNNNIKSIE